MRAIAIGTRITQTTRITAATDKKARRAERMTDPDGRGPVSLLNVRNILCFHQAGLAGLAEESNNLIIPLFLTYPSVWRHATWFLSFTNSAPMRCGLGKICQRVVTLGTTLEPEELSVPCLNTRAAPHTT
jgi:hypothetical protein